MSQMTFGERELIKAIRLSNADEVRTWIERGTKVNFWDENSYTPLLHAASATPEIIQMLIAAGADPNGGDDKGYAPLQQALGGCRLDCAQALLDGGADINYQPKRGDGLSPLHTAVFGDNSGNALVRVPFLIERGAKFDLTMTWQGHENLTPEGLGKLLDAKAGRFMLTEYFINAREDRREQLVAALRANAADIAGDEVDIAAARDAVEKERRENMARSRLDDVLAAARSGRFKLGAR